MDRKFGETRILTIDLGSGETRLDECRKFTEMYLGGRAVNQCILLQRGVDRDEAGIPNRLVIAPGSLVGSSAPSAARTSIDSGNMFNKGIGSGNIGGKIGAYLRFNGYDHLVLEGRAETPKYVFIEEEHVSLKDAGRIWGKTISETDEALRKLHGNEVAMLYIGPAGENLVRTSCIISDKYRAQGRCGLGMILGAMRVKAIVVSKASGRFEMADREGFEAEVARLYGKINNLSEIFEDLGQNGLASKSDLWLQIAMPVKNFQDEYFPPEKQKAFAPEAMASLSTGKGAKGCYQCRIGCDVFMRIPEGAGAGIEWAGVEGNPMWDFGSKLDIIDPGATTYLHVLCNEWGLDEDNTSGAMSWAYECFERDVLTEKDTEGLRLEWGNVDAAVKLIERIAKREGIGNLLADGAKLAAEKVGQGSEGWAIHVKGQDLAEPLRVDKAWALACVVSPRGGTHTRGAPIPFATPPVPEVYDPASYKGQVKRVIRCERMHAMQDALGLCSVPSQWLSEILPGIEDYGRLFSAAIGREMTDEDSSLAGEKIMVLEKIFNQVHGDFDRKDDYPPPRTMNEPVSDGTYKGERLILEEWDKMLDEYYDLHGWHRLSGKVPEKTVKQILMSVNQACK